MRRSSCTAGREYPLLAATKERSAHSIQKKKVAAFILKVFFLFFFFKLKVTVVSIVLGMLLQLLLMLLRQHLYLWLPQPDAFLHGLAL